MARDNLPGINVFLSVELPRVQLRYVSGGSVCALTPRNIRLSTLCSVNRLPPDGLQNERISAARLNDNKPCGKGDDGLLDRENERKFTADRIAIENLLSCCSVVPPGARLPRIVPQCARHS
jgi:hypothetical protein